MVKRQMFLWPAGPFELDLNLSNQQSQGGLKTKPTHTNIACKVEKPHSPFMLQRPRKDFRELQTQLFMGISSSRRNIAALGSKDLRSEGCEGRVDIMDPPKYC